MSRNDTHHARPGSIVHPCILMSSMVCFKPSLYYSNFEPPIGKLIRPVFFPPIFIMKKIQMCRKVEKLVQ